MAFAVASRRAPLAVSGLLKKLLLAAPSASASGAAPAATALHPAASIVAARCLFSTSTTTTPFRLRRVHAYKCEEECSSDEEGVAHPCGQPMCRCRLLALVEDDVVAARRGCMVLGACWASKDDADALRLKVAMPGLGKEHVKVWADQDELAMEGEGDKDAEYDDDDQVPASYDHRIELPADTFKMDQIKAEMKDGVLKVTVPKIKLEDRKDVFQVKVE